MQSAGKAYLPQLTGIRFFAAYLVICHHFLSAPDYPLVGALLQAVGDVAVSLFFVLSGFVLTLSNRREDGSLVKAPVDYVVARVARIYPQYLFAFIIAAPFFIQSTFAEHVTAAQSVPRLLVNAVAYLSMLQSWVPWTANAWNGPAWSLSVEAFFYAVFLRLVPPRAGAILRWQVLGAAAVILPVVVGSMLAGTSIGNFLPRTTWLFFPPFRLGEFLLGIGIAQVFRLGLFPSSLRRFSGAIFTLAIAALVLAMTFLDPLWVRVCSTGLMPLALLCLAQSDGPVSRFLGGKPLVILGDASYGLYLIQLPMFGVYKFVSGNSEMTWANFAAASVLTIAVSVAVHFLIERPAASAIKRRWQERRH